MILKHPTQTQSPKKYLTYQPHLRTSLETELALQ